MKQAEIEIEGASEADITVKSDALFKAEVSESSMLNGSIQAKDLDLDIDGASRVNLAGAANDATIHVHSASTLTMTRLVLQNADVKLSGALPVPVSTPGAS